MKNKRERIIHIIKYIVLMIILFFVIIIPLYMTVINSFKSAKEVTRLNMRLPIDWSIIDNYREVLIEGKLIRGFGNSLLYSFFSVGFCVFFGSLAAWIFGRFKSKYLTLLYFLSISGILVPPAIITSIKVERMLGIYGTYIGMTLFYIGIFTPLVIFFTTGFVKTIPIELEEAARVDGANSGQIFFKIIFPLLRPVQLTSVIFLTIFIWNDFIYPFYLLNKAYQYPMTLGLYNFVNQYFMNPRWELVFADVILVSLPMIIFYITLHRQITSGLMSGAVKG